MYERPLGPWGGNLRQDITKSNDYASEQKKTRNGKTNTINVDEVRVRVGTDYEFPGCVIGGGVYHDLGLLLLFRHELLHSGLSTKVGGNHTITYSD